MRVLMIAGVVLFFALIIGGIAWAGAKGTSREGKKELREMNKVLNKRLFEAEPVPFGSAFNVTGQQAQ